MIVITRVALVASFSPMNPQQLVILGRMGERSATWALAALLLFFAYKLASTRRSQPNQTAEFKWNDILIKLARISPGVFFAILGTVILVTNLRSPLELSYQTKDVKANSSEASNADTVEIRWDQGNPAPPIVDICVTINRVDLFAKTLNGKDDPETIDEIQKVTKRLMGYRDDLLGIAFGKNQISEFQKSSKDPKSIPPNKVATFEALQRAYNSTQLTP